MRKLFSRTAALLLFLSIGAHEASYGQCTTVPFNFTGTPTVVGTAGALGTRYRYANVRTGIDVEFRIDSIYGSATVRAVDVAPGALNPQGGTYSGYSNAWQPVITTPANGIAGEGAVRWVVSFYASGTNYATPYNLGCVSLLAVDIDGDGDQLKEFVQVTNPYSFSGQSNGAFLDYTSASGRLRAVARDITTIDNIDSTQKQAMAVFRFKNVSSFRYTTGFIKGVNNTVDRQFCLFFGYITNFPSAFSRFYDTDGDGVTDINNPVDLDDDNDGIRDVNEYITGYPDPLLDADNDGLANYEDPTPGFTVPGITTFWLDTNGDGVNDRYDADRDGTINSLDRDSDNDGIPDVVEAGGVDANGDGVVDYTGTFASNDTNGNGLIDMYDNTETNPNVTGVTIRNLDSDGDGIPNIIDLDSDNDGIPDVVEAGGTDANGDGRIDNFVDNDTDGLSDLVDGDVGDDGVVENGGAAALIRTGTYTSSSNPVPVSYPLGIANDDGRNLPNFIDLDSDDDGISDVTEALGIDANYDGIADNFTDADGDGFNDNVDGEVNGVVNVSKALLATGADTNNDGRPDSYPTVNADGTFRPNPYDSDSDDDGIPDIIEAGGVDANGGGRVDADAFGNYVDANGNGWLDFYDPTVAGGINLRTLDVNGPLAGSVFDFDGDGKPNFIDLDSDNDGIADIIEQGGTDANNDGKVDYTGTYAANDLDLDGFIDVYDPIDNAQPGSVPSGKTPLITAGGPVDATTKLPTNYSAGDNMDSYGLINMLDLDADNDGILDTRESGISSGTNTSLDANNDGVVDAVWTDANGDGWADVVKGLPLFVLRNTDGIGQANYLDIDSDDDGIPDNIESQTTAGYIAPAGTDADFDGIDDAYDNDDAAYAGNANNGLSLTDTDGDGTSDYRDLDSDNDGKSDRLEGWDTDGNNAINGSEKAYSSPADTDGDGLLDAYDAVVNNNTNARINIFNNTTPTSYPDKNNPGGDRDWRQVQDTDKDGIPDITDLDDDNDGIPDTVECPNCTTKVFQNGGFELPAYAGAVYNNSSAVPGWSTTASDNLIEIWSNGYNGVPPAQGNQLVEINATQAATLYQNFCLNGTGATIMWSIKHRGRAGVDSAAVGFGTDINSLTRVAVMADGNSAWGTYSGSYNVPAGITNIFIGLTAIRTATGDLTVGNFVDDVQITIYQQSACDNDGDGIPNTLDLDSDGDGIPDIVEAGGIDANGDGTVDFTGTFGSNDTNGDGLINTYDVTATGGVAIANLDTDGDGIPNVKDLDSDNDGIPDVVEAGGIDADNDGKLDNTTDADGDGLSDLVDGDIGNIGGSNVNTTRALILTSTGTNGVPTSYLRANADGNGLPNPYDLDSDGDGLLDSRESGLNLDTNNDGVIKSGDTGWADANGDGWADNVDALNILPVVDGDSDTKPNYLDIDSDNDGIPDNIEAQTTTGYLAPLGTDADKDGIDDRYDNNTSAFGGNATNGLNPVDTDGDGIRDYRDTDSDNDGKPDRLEGWDTSGNGTINGSEKAYVGTNDTDGDGLLDEYDAVNGIFTTNNVTNNTTPGSYPDVNNPGGDRDWRQAQDSDKDGIIDTVDLDDDNDGIPDTVECPTCTTAVFQNGGFEQPAYGTSDVNYHLVKTVPGWNTTQPDGDMEIWSNGYAGVTPYAGTQLLELNATQAATVYQSFCLNGKGATILWTVRHRGRNGVDVASVGFGTSATNLTTVQTMTDGTTGWTTYSGIYTAPAGVTNLVMGLTSISNANGIPFEGNLIDGVDIQIVSQNCDTDGDGIPDSLDLDGDGDGIPDLVEAGGIDANGDGTVDFTGTWASNDTDNDGLFDLYDASETNPLVVGAAIRNLDTDGDGIPNAKDLDSDNDGIADVTEAGGVDANYDGILDNMTDADNDGLSDLVDGDIGNTGGSNINTTRALILTSTGTLISGRPDSYPRANADGIGLPNPYDLDSDDDGVPDLIEAGGIDTNGDGRVDATGDANGNGWTDFYDPTALGGINLRTLDANGATAGGLTFDFDGDGIANYLDLDSDGDGIPDIVEQGGADTNNNGKADGTVDSDGDGFLDIYDPINGGVAGTPIILTGSTLNTFNYPSTYSSGDNVDGMGLINMLDLDADGDGITDVKEAGFAESGTTPGFAAGTLGSNGWSTTVSGSTTTTLALPNTDNRGPVNYLDIDSDDDGITDNVEGQATYSYKLPTGVDTDADGIDDAYEVAIGMGGAGIVPVNTDNTDVADYLDSDSDNDGQTDLKEGLGNPFYTLSNFTDTDGDGLLDVFDTFTMTTVTPANPWNNITMAKMGANGIFSGPSVSGNNNTPLPQTSAAAGADRDWRNAAYILPIKLVSFTAVYNNHVTNLSWTATGESRSDRYVVERSIDGKNFQAISSVNARGNGGNYTTTDNAVPAVNVVYYRLQMVDASGNVTYSKVIAIKLVADKMNLSIYPNPVVDMVSISFASVKAQAVTIKVYNASGAQVMTKAFQAQVGTNTLQLTDWNRLPAGDYMIEVGNENFKMIEKISHLH